MKTYQNKHLILIQLIPLGTPTRNQGTCSDAGAFFVSALAGDREGFLVRGYPSSIRTFVQSVAMGSAVFTWDLLMSSFLR